MVVAAIIRQAMKSTASNPGVFVVGSGLVLSLEITVYGNFESGAQSPHHSPC
jgi:hypothetical protein